MLKYFRQNPMIAAGILLPLIVVAFFVLATAIPKLLADPPAHDFLFSVPYSDGSKPSIEVRFDVVDERLRARLYKTNVGYRRVPKLYLFEHETLEVREISVDLPGDTEDFEDADEIEIAEFADRLISTDRTAPDGYEVRQPGYRGGDLMTSLFGGRRRNRLAIHKSGAVINVRHPGNNLYYYSNVTFLGWVTDRSQ